MTWHLPFALLVLPLLCALHQRYRLAGRRGRHWWRAGFAGGCVVLLVGCVLYYLELVMSRQLAHNPTRQRTQQQADVHFWVQLVTGNWSAPPASYYREPLWMTLSIMLSVGLNFLSLGLFAAVFWLARQLLQERNVKMTHLLAARDEAILTAFERLLRDSDTNKDERIRLERMLARAMSSGDAEWKDIYFRELYSDEAEEKRKKLQSASI